MTKLLPVPHQIGIFDDFIASRSETMVLRETLLDLSGHSFDIKIAGGQPLFHVHGRCLASPGRKSVTDAAGNHLFDVVKKRLHMHDTYVVQDAEGNTLLSIRNSILKFVGSKATTEFQSYLGQSEKLTIRGNWLSTSAEIMCMRTGAIIASIEHRPIRSGDVPGKQPCALRVAPGVDVALIIALCIAFNERNDG